MPRTAGVVLIASALFILGLQALSAGAPPAVANNTLATRTILGVLGLISIAVAITIWRRQPAALKAYALWAGAWLIGGAAVQYLTGVAPVAEIVIWWVFVGAALAAAGLYLRSALRPTT